MEKRTSARAREREREREEKEKAKKTADLLFCRELSVCQSLYGDCVCEECVYVRSRVGVGALPSKTYSSVVQLSQLRLANKGRLGKASPTALRALVVASVSEGLFVCLVVQLLLACRRVGAENIFGPYAFAAFSLFRQSGSAMLQREKGRAAVKIALGL